MEQDDPSKVRKKAPTFLSEWLLLVSLLRSLLLPLRSCPALGLFRPFCLPCSLFAGSFLRSRGGCALPFAGRPAVGLAVRCSLAAGCSRGLLFFRLTREERAGCDAVRFRSKHITVSKERLFILTHRQHNANFLGNPLLQATKRHLKQHFESFMCLDLILER